jgi:hypothetical protein
LGHISYIKTIVISGYANYILNNGHTNGPIDKTIKLLKRVNTA